MFIVTLALGLAVVPAIACSPMYAARLRLRSPRLGTASILAAVGLGFVCVGAPEAVPRNEFFLCAFALMLLGALLLAGEDPDEPSDSDGDEPPWWPEFEAELRRYRQRSRLPVVTR
jgi:hypothetical protein